MSLLQKLIGAGLRPRVRSKARGKSLEQLANQLGASFERLEPLYARALDTAGNREAFNHWLGIERWSQSRLRVARGAALTMDKYHGYRLPDGATLDELRDAFREARAATIALAEELAEEGVDPALKIPSNDLGELSVAEWFEYIDDHSSRERIRLRLRPAENGPDPRSSR